MSLDADLVDYIRAIDLFELPSVGNYFTWRGGINMSVHNKNRKTSYYRGMIRQFSSFFCILVNHSTSNYTPIILNFAAWLLSRKEAPLKYNNFWHLREDYYGIIQSVWGELGVGNPLFQLISKLKKQRTIFEFRASNIPKG